MHFSNINTICTTAFYTHLCIDIPVVGPIKSNKSFYKFVVQSSIDQIFNSAMIHDPEKVSVLPSNRQWAPASFIAGVLSCKLSDVAPNANNLFTASTTTATCWAICTHLRKFAICNRKKGQKDVLNKTPFAWFAVNMQNKNL